MGKKKQSVLACLTSGRSALAAVFFDRKEWLLFNTIASSAQFEPHSSIGSVQDLRTGDIRFDFRLGQYFLQGLMIVIATGLIPLSLLSILSTIVM